MENQQKILDFFFMHGVLGLTFCEPEVPKSDVENYLQWISEGHQLDMEWMDNQKRLSPKKLFPEAKTAIILILDYRKKKNPTKLSGRPKVSDYALSRDYHKISKKLFKKSYQFFRDHWPEESLRCFCDTAPILEKPLAKSSGLVWQGKNTLCLHPEWGSKFFIASVLTSLEIPRGLFKAPDNDSLSQNWIPSRPVQDLCLDCDLCIKACPTQALKPYEFVTNRCIAYHNIEKKDKSSQDLNLRNWLFGCDICQDVCPYNRQSPDPLNKGNANLLSELNSVKNIFQKEKLEELIQEENEKEITEKLAGTPLLRAKVKGLKEIYAHNQKKNNSGS